MSLRQDWAYRLHKWANRLHPLPLIANVELEAQALRANETVYFLGTYANIQHVRVGNGRGTNLTVRT